MRAALNERLTHIGLGTPCGKLLRHYWQPVALTAEFDPALDSRMGVRPAKAVRALGQDFVLFRDALTQKFVLLDRACPHRGADLAFGRLESAEQGGGIRCAFHGWHFRADGQCIATPGEPKGSRLCDGIKQRSYPVVEKSGVIWAWLAPEGVGPSAFPSFDCFVAPETHTFAFKGLWNCNWLQAMEVGIDPAHASFLHRFFEDEDVSASYGKQFRAASSDSDWPMTRVLREFESPEISVEATDYGMRLTALRRLSETLMHVRVTNQLFPQAFVIPLSSDTTITQWHLPVDDTHTYWVAIFTSFGKPLDKALMREQRLKLYSLPDYVPRVGKHNQYGFDPIEQRDETYTGMGHDINVHDQWAVESQGEIQDRTKEHLGTTDKAIIANRRQLSNAIDAVEKGEVPPFVWGAADAENITGPITVDGICAADSWEQYWRESDAKRRAQCEWRANNRQFPSPDSVPPNHPLPAGEGIARG
jgi:phthalate 4,5-dioxygenase